MSTNPQTISSWILSVSNPWSRLFDKMDREATAPRHVLTIRLGAIMEWGAR